MLLINISYPQLLYGFFKAFGGNSPIDSLDYVNILNKYIVRDNQEKKYLTHQYLAEHVGESIFRNSGGCFTIIALMWGISIPLILIYKNNNKIKSDE